MAKSKHRLVGCLSGQPLPCQSLQHAVDPNLSDIPLAWISSRLPGTLQSSLQVQKPALLQAEEEVPLSHFPIAFQTGFEL